MDAETDQLLREVASSAYGRADGDLLYFVMQYRNRTDLPSYQPLVNRVREVLLTRHDEQRVDHMLRFVSPDGDQTGSMNTGHPDHRHN